MNQDTIFHKIVRGDIPCAKVYEDDDVLVFEDIHPKAPTHWLLIAKKPEDFIASIADITEDTRHVPGMLINTARELAEQKGINGYKLTFHVGEGGGQEVFYTHLHFLSQQKTTE